MRRHQTSRTFYLSSTNLQLSSIFQGQVHSEHILGHYQWTLKTVGHTTGPLEAKVTLWHPLYSNPSTIYIISREQQTVPNVHPMDTKPAVAKNDCSTLT